MSSVVVDLIYRIDVLPAAGTNEVATETMIAAGGGFNAMVAAKRSGMEVAYGGSHGTGLFGDIVRSALAQAEIPVLQPQLSHLDQGNCVVLVDSAGERTFVSKDGADGFLTEPQLSAVDPAEEDWVLVSGYVLSYPNSADVISAWLSSLPTETTLVFDPSPVISHVSDRTLEAILARADWITANSIEASIITNEPDPRTSAKALMQGAGVHCKGIVVRAGSDGAWICSRGTAPVQIPGFSVATIDTNGAGDAHVGSFIASMAGGYGFQDAIVYANASAALSTTHFGPSTAPTEEEVEAFLERRQGKGADFKIGKAR